MYSLKIKIKRLLNMTRGFSNQIMRISFKFHYYYITMNREGVLLIRREICHPSKQKFTVN